MNIEHLMKCMQRMVDFQSCEYCELEHVCEQGEECVFLDVREALQKVPTWIPVAERLPESGTRALVMRFDFVTETPFYDLLWFDKGEWWNRRYTGDFAVTHWMPRPEPPEEVEA